MAGIKNEEIIYSRTKNIRDNIQEKKFQEQSLMVNCVEFDQDCFYDLRMLFADESQNEWIATTLPELVAVPVDYYKSLTEQEDKTGCSLGESEVMKQAKDMREVDHTILSKLSVQNITLLGSTQDGLYLEKGVTLFDSGRTGMNYSDVDMIIEYGGIEIKTSLDKNADNLYFLLKHTIYPGYFKLKICTNDFESEQLGYFKNSLLKMKLYGDLDFGTYYVSKHGITGSENMASVYGNTENEFGINEVDYVAAFQLHSWQGLADEFISRKRPNDWPSTELVEKLVARGCGLVPKGMSTSRETEYEWRISYAVQEKMLSRSLSKTQIRAYLLLKTILKQLLNEPEGLSSYMTKNILFWTVETMPSSIWRDDNVLLCVEAMMNMLCECLDQATISSYFMPSLNLISNVGSRTVQILSKKSKFIHRNIFQAIVYCSGLPEFKGICDVSLTMLASSFSVRRDQALDYCSSAYFTMYLFLRLQSLRYQLTVNLKVLKEAYKSDCPSVCFAIPARAAWYLIESIKFKTDDLKCTLLKHTDQTYTLDVGGLREAVVGFWRSDIYTGIFKKVISDQEFVKNEAVQTIPEFRSFVDWVDLTVVWDNGKHIHPEYIQYDGTLEQKRKSQEMY